MNILFVGPYRQNDGWGLATQSYIRALASTNNNITIRPVFLAGNSGSDLDSDLLSLENSRYDNYDLVIQKTLPHCLFYNGHFKKNIGLFVLETNNIQESSCIANINLMDEVWVPSEQEKKCLIKSGVSKPVRSISQPLDVSFIKENINHKISFGSILDQTFKFYFIGEYVERKNLHDLILAFHLAFNIGQQVSLIIKTSISGKNPHESKKIIEKDIETIKKQLNISSKYKKEIVITEYLSYKDLIGLHNACDCFVMPSYGEAFCRPAAEALVLGKTPIVTDNTGMIDHINNENGFIIKSYKTPVVVSNRTLSNEFDIYNANEYWYKINVYSLIEHMQTVYNMNKQDKKTLTKKKQVGMDTIETFSYKTIGTKLCI